MSGDETLMNERQGLLNRLLDAVKQCQVRFGGRTELATDGDSRVSCLCAAWEAALQHGMKHNNKALSAFKQVTEMTGLSKMAGVFGDIKNLETEPTYWVYVKEHLTKHEVQRYMALKSIGTDAGRGRAWLRASLNEHSLERYMHMLIEDELLLNQYYEDWAFLRDQERSSMLPMMAAGLGSILFAITIDKSELNTIRQAPINVAAVTASPSPRALEEPKPVIGGEVLPDKKKERKKKKKITNIVSFGEGDDDAYSSSPSSLKSPTLSVTDYSLSQHKFTYTTPGVAQSGSPSRNGSVELRSVENSVSQNAIEENTDTELREDNTQSSADDRSGLHVDSFVQQNNIDSSVQQRDSFGNENTTGNIVSGVERDTARLKISSLPLDVNSPGGQDSIGSRSPNPSSWTSDHEPSITSLSSVDRPSSRGSYSSAEVDASDVQETLTPITPTGKVMDVHLSLAKDEISRSVDSTSDLPSYMGEDVESAVMALALAQKGYTSPGHRTEGDGGNTREISQNLKQETMSTQELKQAVVAMMMRKDEVEEQNRSLRAMFEQEMETSSTLRAEIEEVKLVHMGKQEKDNAKILSLQKENELLKHQLRKYVNAVQLLRKGEEQMVSLGIHLEDPQPAIPPSKPAIDYSHEAMEYEKKLIQVAEMHGELMEFNELLHRQLNGKDNLVKQLRQQLVELRGPVEPVYPSSSRHLNLPEDESSSEDYGDFDSLLQSRTLINIWIPSAFLRGSSTDTHHVYQVYVRVRDEEWNVYRRYNQFHDFLSKLKKPYPIISKFEFPPKKALGSKDAKVVEMRRKMLQSFLRNIINFMMQHDSDLADNTCKDQLLETMPFFGDPPTKDKGKKNKKKLGSGGRRQSGPANQPQSTPATAPPQYTGL